MALHENNNLKYDAIFMEFGKIKIQKHQNMLKWEINCNDPTL